MRSSHYRCKIRHSIKLSFLYIMRVSQFFISTLKEAPSEAELPSHILMVRAGYIKKLASGLYTWMPLGLRALRKVEAIVREEMNNSGALELLMPAVQPADEAREPARAVAARLRRKRLHRTARRADLRG